MTTIAHVLSATYIAAKVANVVPTETDYLVIMVLSSSLIDLDHVYFLIKDHHHYRIEGYAGHLHKARSPLHELIGFWSIGVVMLGVALFDSKLALVVGLPAMIHLIEDMIMGVSVPFTPIDKTEVQMLPQKKSLKIALDLIVIVVFGLLWIQYLNAPN